MSRIFCDLRSQKTPRGILPVDGEGGKAAALRENLGGTTRGRQELELLPQSAHGAHHGASQRGLTRSGRSAKHHHAVVAAVGEETAKHLKGRRLVGRGLKAKLGDDAPCELLNGQLR